MSREKKLTDKIGTNETCAKCGAEFPGPGHKCLTAFPTLKELFDKTEPDSSCNHSIGTSVDEEGCCSSCGEDLNHTAMEHDCEIDGCTICSGVRCFVCRDARKRADRLAEEIIQLKQSVEDSLPTTMTTCDCGRYGVRPRDKKEGCWLCQREKLTREVAIFRQGWSNAQDTIIELKKQLALKNSGDV